MATTLVGTQETHRAVSAERTWSAELTPKFIGKLPETANVTEVTFTAIYVIEDAGGVRGHLRHPLHYVMGLKSLVVTWRSR